MLPEVPVPKLTATQALAIAQKRLSNAKNFTLVGIEWCKASDFKPRFSDGTQYSPGNDHADEYSWFVTYVYRDEEVADAFKKMGITRQFNAVSIVRINNDGQVASFVGFRT